MSFGFVASYLLLLQLIAFFIDSVGDERPQFPSVEITAGLHQIPSCYSIVFAFEHK